MKARSRTWLAVLLAHLFLIGVVTYTAASILPGPNWENRHIALSLWGLDFAVIAGLVGWLLGHPLVMRLVDLVPIVLAVILLPMAIYFGGFWGVAIVVGVLILPGTIGIVFGRRALGLVSESRD